MGDDRSRFRQSPAFALGEMDAMGEDAALAQQTEAVIDIGIVLVAGIERSDAFDLAFALLQMRLHQRIGEGLEQLARQFELRLGRGDGKARRHDIA
jgi:hypothetical protein